MLSYSAKFDDRHCMLLCVRIWTSLVMAGSVIVSAMTAVKKEVEVMVLCVHSCVSECRV